MDKKDIIDLLERIGTMMEIKGENPLKLGLTLPVPVLYKPWRMTWVR